MKAFPLLSKWDDEKLNGMDLRDYFAAKAMQAMLSWEDVGSFNLSKEAYMIADAMMESRK